MEGTPTWFGMLLPDGSKLAAVEAIEIGWKGKLDPTTNRVPVIQPLQLSVKDKVAEGAVFKVEASALDPDGDTLDWHWTLLAEVGYSIGGDAQDAAPEFPDSIVKGQGTPSVEVKLPGGGVYRLYAYVRDGKGNAAYASEIVQGEGKPPKLTLPKQPVPCPVYTDGHKSPWIPSGYMGEQQAIKMEADCDKSPHSGETCMRVEFAKSAGWGGVLWQNPANDWGDTPGGFDLSDATMLEIWARGEKGGEAITFQVGGLEGKPFSDSFKAQKRDIVLKKDWTRYRIALDGVDLSRVKTCFGWVLTVHGEPIVFYLDDIRFIAD